MRNKKVIVTVLILSLMLMGAGYAAWTQSFDVQATVNTGELKVVYTEDGPGLYELEKGMKVEEWKYQSADYTFDENTFDFSINELYPGVHVCINQAMENVGTIPAVFDSATVVFDSDSDPTLLNDAIVEFDWYSIYDGNGSLKEKSGYGITFPILQFEEYLNQELAGVSLEPGDSLVLGDIMNKHFDITLPSTTTNDTENKTLGFTITMNFKQFNIDK